MYYVKSCQQLSKNKLLLWKKNVLDKKQNKKAKKKILFSYIASIWIYSFFNNFF